MQTQSILYRTLWLFGFTFLAVAVVFAGVIWWVLRRGRPAEVLTPHDPAHFERILRHRLTDATLPWVAASA